MYSILLDVWRYVEGLKPSFLSRTPHFNFLTCHYFWIVGNAILGSICLYANGKIPYVDALFLGCGAATQSGLNTIDINSLNTWQQSVLYTIPMFTNPITINTFVVFLRLYWFEKRFQHVASEAKKGRRSIAKTISKARSIGRDVVDEELGINGRNIVVMHGGNSRLSSVKSEGDLPEDEQEKDEVINAEMQARSRSSNESGETSKRQSSASGAESTHEHALRPGITFADQVKRSNGLPDQDLRIPSPRSTEEHIAFLERQRNGEDSTVLRIPGPRDADAGIAPTAVDEMDPTTRTISRRESGFSKTSAAEHLHFNDHTGSPKPRRGITITEPPRPSTLEHVATDAHAAKNTATGALRLRRPNFMKRNNDEDGSDLHRTKSKVPTLGSLKRAWTHTKDEGMPYLSWEATVGRNSAFVDLTEEQREELGGIEYRSLKSLALILVLYFVGFSVFAIIGLLPWVMHSKHYGAVVNEAGQGRPWWAIYTSSSALNDVGFTLTPNSMVSFNAARWPLVLMSFLIIIGNTGFPIMLRIIIWGTSKWVPRESGIWEELKFLLDHPRRCFTLLFPAKATWWLFWILVLLNGLDLILFIILDLRNPIITSLPINVRVLDGWFQAVCTRTAGFSVVNLAELHPAVQVSYLVMMYISVLPIAISVRRTNVYEEKSLGIYNNTNEENEDEAEPSYVGAHLRRQLSFDLWYIFLGFFIIAIAEGSRIQSGDPAFTMYSILFEVVSAYGTVGLSLGYTDINASFSAEFGVVAKLVIVAMQIRGRHRGLPYELDRAILLPSEHLQKKEAADAALRVRRRSSVGPPPTATGFSSRMERSRTRSIERRPTNVLSSMLHPGPTMPSSHRYAYRDPPRASSTGTGTRRRHSFATTGMRGGRGRDESPRSNNFFPSFFSGATDGGTEASPAKKAEGRRSFYKEGVNPEPDLGPKDESKQS